MKKLALILTSLLCFNYAYSNDPGNLVRAIQSHDNVSCQWVNNVGDTTAAENVTLIEMGPDCRVEGNEGGENRLATAVCKGTIRCAGLGNGWGDVYFEGVHCPGRNLFGKAVCGRAGTSNSTNRNFPEGVKSCLASFITNDGTVTNNGSNQVIKQTPTSLGVSQ